MPRTRARTEVQATEKAAQSNHGTGARGSPHRKARTQRWCTKHHAKVKTQYGAHQPGTSRHEASSSFKLRNLLFWLRSPYFRKSAVRSHAASVLPLSPILEANLIFKQTDERVEECESTSARRTKSDLDRPSRCRSHLSEEKRLDNRHLFPMGYR